MRIDLILLGAKLKYFPRTFPGVPEIQVLHVPLMPCSNALAGYPVPGLKLDHSQRFFLSKLPSPSPHHHLPFDDAPFVRPPAVCYTDNHGHSFDCVHNCVNHDSGSSWYSPSYLVSKASSTYPLDAAMHAGFLLPRVAYQNLQARNLSTFFRGSSTIIRIL